MASLRVMMLCFFSSISTVSSQSCFNERECAGLTSLINDFLHCWGYQSCSNVDLIQISDLFTCWGSHSCFNSSKVEITADESSCQGFKSCANIPHFFSNSILCYGSMSCLNSNMSLISGDLYCWGFRSCSNTYIMSQENNYIYGYLAAQNTTFISNDTGSVTYTFYGPESGKNGKIICGIGGTCTVNCRSNACNTLTLECADGNADSCTFRIFGCNGGSEKSNICPNGYSLNNDIIFNTVDPIPSLSNILLYPELSIFDANENSINACNPELTGAINCGTVQECNSADFDTNVSFCCTATASCNHASINTNIDINILVNPYDNGVHCDGYVSCDAIFEINATNGGNIYFGAGSDEWFGSRINDASIVSTTIEYNIICSGYRSCVDNIMLNANNIYCIASSTCRNTKLIDNINNVFAYGYLGLYNSSVSNINDNVYCAGYWACLQTIIVNVGNNVIGTGRESLTEAKISHVANNVICIGYRACYQAIITDNENVCVLCQRKE